MIKYDSRYIKKDYFGPKFFTRDQNLYYRNVATGTYFKMFTLQLVLLSGIHYRVHN